MLGDLRLAAAVCFSLALSACAGGSDLYQDQSGYSGSAQQGDTAEIVQPSAPMECVPYAREESGIDIHGDAVTWWDQADGRYERGGKPIIGAVLVLADYAGPKHAHLAVVRFRDSPRLIRVDHANWLNDGAIYLNDPVADVSPDNDWSAVRIWNPRIHAWGARTYLVRGFILPGEEGAGALVAQDY